MAKKIKLPNGEEYELQPICHGDPQDTWRSRQASPDSPNYDRYGYQGQEPGALKTQDQSYILPRRKVGRPAKKKPTLKEIERMEVESYPDLPKGEFIDGVFTPKAAIGDSDTAIVYRVFLSGVTKPADAKAVLDKAGYKIGIKKVYNVKMTYDRDMKALNKYVELMKKYPPEEWGPHSRLPVENLKGIKGDYFAHIPEEVKPAPKEAVEWKEDIPEFGDLGMTPRPRATPHQGMYINLSGGEVRRGRDLQTDYFGSMLPILAGVGIGLLVKGRTDNKKTINPEEDW